MPKLSQNMCLEKGPNEAYADFLARLETAISHNVIKKEVKIQKKKKKNCLLMKIQIRNIKELSLQFMRLGLLLII